MKYRVIEENQRFFVEKKTGLLFKSWEKITKDGIPLDYDHDWEDAEPIHFKEREDAILFMTAIASPKPDKSKPKVIAWI